MSDSREWTIYLAQDKHLDYNWCGTHAEIETRMAAVLDHFIDQAERHGGRWNLDGTIWMEAYRRQRGEAGAQRLLDAIRAERIGYAANYSVLLWGLLSTELSLRALYGSLEIERATATPNRTVLLMENVALPWGLANVLSAAGLSDMGRGVYTLRAESYNAQRDPYPLFWWVAPDGGRLLVRWDLYASTRSWGGYAEAAELGFLGGQVHDPQHMQRFDASCSPEVFERRCAFIRDTVARYVAYGDAYPISSILLLGTGHDQWAPTEDYRLFVEQFNAQSDGRVRLVDARYEDFFAAARQEIAARGLALPELRGSFGICWEEWGAHLGGLTAQFRQAERLLRQAEAAHALDLVRADEPTPTQALLNQAWGALLDFAEHDMGGIDRRLAAISAGVRSAAATEALDIARALSAAPEPVEAAPEPVEGATSSASARACEFAWRGGRVRFDVERGGIASLVDAHGVEWAPQGRGPAFDRLASTSSASTGSADAEDAAPEPVEGAASTSSASAQGPALGALVHTRYPSAHQRAALFPEALDSPAHPRTDLFLCRRGPQGVEARLEGERYGFRYAARWFFHAAEPSIDLTYDLEGGWDEEAQTLQVVFPLEIADARYRYDMAGAILTAGPRAAGGDDLPGANPQLYAVQTFAAAIGDGRHALLLTPDAFLMEFGPGALRAPEWAGSGAPAMLSSMPLMNLTRTDHQFGQGGQRRWRFRYRLVLSDAPYSDLAALDEAQRFAEPPFLQTPGVAPASEAVRALEIDFPGGPVLTLKPSADGRRLIVRLWNVLDRAVTGRLTLPDGFDRAEPCDGLERPMKGGGDPAPRQATFEGPARAIVTLALRRAEGAVGDGR